MLPAAIVGCGKRSRVHAAALRASGAFRLAAVCDVDEGRLSAAAGELGVDRLYRDPAELVARERPALVAIATRPEERAAIVEEVVSAGAEHVLLEKPIALRPSDVDRVRALADRALLVVNTQYAWMPHWRLLYEAVADGVLGDLHTIMCSTRTNALEQGPHVLDVALRLAGAAGASTPEFVLAAAAGVEAFGEVPVPADMTAVVGLGDARLYWTQGPSAPEVPGETTFWYHIQVAALGSRGSLWVSLNRGWWLRAEARNESGDTSWPADDEVAQVALYRDLAARIRGAQRGPFPTEIGHAAACSDLIFAGFASAAQRKRIEISADPRR